MTNGITSEPSPQDVERICGRPSRREGGDVLEYEKENGDMVRFHFMADTIGREAKHPDLFVVSMYHPDSGHWTRAVLSPWTRSGGGVTRAKRLITATRGKAWTCRSVCKADY
ncbi:MAG: hypothetical protein JXQ73_05400 [Phycisphaerae bacterium]|nr:hypothetical protein [Phycisphaerae bacterium]